MYIYLINIFILSMVNPKNVEDRCPEVQGYYFHFRCAEVHMH